MERELTLIEHLSELRKRIIICLAALIIASSVSLLFSSSVLKILKLPAAGVINKLAIFSPEEAFLIYMRIGFLCGFILAMPVILHQLLLFVSPAIEGKIRRYTGSFILFCFLSFIIGGLFAYFILIPPALKFCLSFAKDDFEPVISAAKYISFMVNLILGCGLVFQAPVLSLILTKLGIINSKILRSKYKYAFVAILIIAAIITPTTDIFNMLILALPMLFLYEISIWVSFLATFRKKRSLIVQGG